LQDGLAEQREADGKTGGNARPPERGGRPLHFFLAQPADDFVDDGRRRRGALLDLLGLALGLGLLAFLLIVARSGLIRLIFSSLSRQGICPARGVAETAAW
jgi:hypothetical protein